LTLKTRFNLLILQSIYEKRKSSIILYSTLDMIVVQSFPWYIWEESESRIGENIFLVFKTKKNEMNECYLFKKKKINFLIFFKKKSR
jgi:hypothetical protein